MINAQPWKMHKTGRLLMIWLGKTAAPLGNRRHLAVQDHIPGVAFYQLSRKQPVFRKKGMLDRFLDEPINFQPPAGAQMQGRNRIGSRLAQRVAQQVGKQVMIAVPLALVIQRDEKQVGAFQ